jgi:hypothetical protein
VPEKCCIAVHNQPVANDGGFRLLKDSGAALQVLLDTGNWYWNTDPGAPFDGPFPLDRFQSVFGKESNRFLPDNILELKKYRQGYLFDNIFPITHKKLIVAFEKACIQGASQLTGEQRQKPLWFNDLCALALRILCLHVLDQRRILLGGAAAVGVYGKQKSAGNFVELLAKAKALPDELRAIKKYVDHGSFASLGNDVAAAIFGALVEHPEFDYAGVTSDMLGPFYQLALLKDPEKTQKQEGIFYTSRRITQVILDRLPIEEIPPENRYVLDPTCGSGSFMMAAEERLLPLVRPRKLPQDQKASIVSRFIQGNDKDRFALEVAELALALDHPESEYHYHFANQDIDQPTGEPYCHKPSIIVGNPPFLRHGNTDERAARFLDVFIRQWLEPNGLLGLIMPATFLNGKGRCRDVRDYVMGACEILEIWDLPPNIISSPPYDRNGAGGTAGGNIETCAVFLRKRKRVRNQVSFYKVFQVANLRDSRGSFRNRGTPTRTSVVTLNANSESFSKMFWPSSVVSDILLRIRSQAFPLAELCGPHGVANGIKENGEAPFPLGQGRVPSGDLVPWLKSARGCDEYSQLTALPEPGSLYIHYPGNLERPRLRELACIDARTGNPVPLTDGSWRVNGIFAHKKILVHKNQNASSLRRVKALIDTGHYASDSFHIVWIDPKSPVAKEWSYEELLAILNGPVAQAWMRFARTVNMPTNVLREIPLPRLDQASRESLRQKVANLLKLSNEARIQAIDEIDELVLQAYSLSGPEKEQILATLKPPKAPVSDAAWVDERSWPMHGCVEKILEATDQFPVRVQIRILDFSTKKQIYVGEVPPEMPGWALVPNVEFEAEIPWSDAEKNEFDCRKVRRFRPLPFAYRRVGGTRAKGV